MVKGTGQGCCGPTAACLPGARMPPKGAAMQCARRPGPAASHRWISLRAALLAQALLAAAARGAVGPQALTPAWLGAVVHGAPSTGPASLPARPPCCTRWHAVCCGSA